jgi:hypothetical protein
MFLLVLVFVLSGQAVSFLKFAPTALVVPGTAVALVDAGDVLGGVTLPGPFDGMGLMLNPLNNSEVHLIVNSEANPSSVTRITLEAVFPYTPVKAEILFSNLGRLCSGTLVGPSSPGLFFGGDGTTSAVYFSGEESADGRAFAFFLGLPTPFQITNLGRLQFENLSPCPYPQAKTFLCATDDTNPGYVVCLAGTKQSTGSEFDKTGLNSSTPTAYGVKV